MGEGLKRVARLSGGLIVSDGKTTVAYDKEGKAMNTWPKHPDGRPMKLGEMSDEQRREQFRAAGKRLQAEFENPLVKEKLIAALNGENVKQ